MCWETVTGSNCNECYKCQITYMGIMAENIDPNLYGFDISKEVIKNEMPNMWKQCGKLPNGELKSSYVGHWVDMQNVFIKNKEHFKNTPEVQWIYKIDFIKEMNKYNKNVRYNNTMNKIKNTKYDSKNYYKID